MAKNTSKAARSPDRIRPQLGVWQMLRDVLVASINKGQFPLAILGIIILSIIWRMPPEDLSKLVFEIKAEILNGHLFGYALSFVMLGGWYYHSRVLKQTYTNEIERVTAERNRVQTEVLGQRIQSSE